MRRILLAALLTLIALSAPAQQPEKKHILFLGLSHGWAHDSVSHAMYTMQDIGRESGLFDVRFHTDMELLTKEDLGGNKKNLDWFDAVMFFTQGDPPLTDRQKADFMNFVKVDGKGVLISHSGTDSFRESWPDYVEMAGGAFLNHPWNQEVRVLVDDRGHPATEHFPPSFEIADEIYQLNRYSRDNVRVLMRLDTSSVDMGKDGVQRTDEDFALAWARTWGKGRVFTSVLGHRESVWDRDDIRQMWLGAVRWVLGMEDADTASLPLPTEDD